MHTQWNLPKKVGLVALTPVAHNLIVTFIIVTTLGLNIVIAILVDRFSELREERVSNIISM